MLVLSFNYLVVECFFSCSGTPSAGRPRHTLSLPLLFGSRVPEPLDRVVVLHLTIQQRNKCIEAAQPPAPPQQQATWPHF
jgi:hypothetical protein